MLDICAIRKTTERQSRSAGEISNNEKGEELDTYQRGLNRHFRLPSILALEWELEVNPFGKQCSGTELYDHARADR